MNGRIQLLQGDCLDLMKQIPDGSVDMVLTDPPYNISRTSSIDRSRFKSEAMRRSSPVSLDFGHWDKMGRSEFVDFTRKWLVECARCLREGGAFVCFFEQSEISLLKWIGEECGIRHRNIFTWRKSNPVPSIHQVNYLSACEQVFIGSKGDAKWTFNFTTQQEMHNIFTTPNKSVYGVTDHPCEKPITLLRHFLQIHTKDGCSVLDPFMGSGSTGIACIDTGRNFIGIEKDEKYFNVAKARIEKAMSMPKQGELPI